MLDLKEVFNGKALSFEDFEKAVNEKKMKLADLSGGEYVSKAKFDAQTAQVEELTKQIKQRDTDIKTVQDQLANAKTDEGKLLEVNKNLEDLKAKYVTDTQALTEKIARQSYEFKVKERASGLKFSSNSAKKAFINEALTQDFKDDDLKGFDDFLKQYKAGDPAAFAEEQSKPKFSQPGGTQQPPADVNGFNFNVPILNPLYKK